MAMQVGELGRDSRSSHWRTPAVIILCGCAIGTKRYILSTVYFTRALATLAFISFPITPFSAIAFGAILGLTDRGEAGRTSGCAAGLIG